MLDEMVATAPKIAECIADFKEFIDNEIIDWMPYMIEMKFDGRRFAIFYKRWGKNHIEIIVFNWRCSSGQNDSRPRTYEVNRT